MNGPVPVQILLVEDNPGDVDLTREALKDWKILNALTVVNDGVEALAYLRGEGRYRDAPRPDLILLDLNLPRKDGREVLSEIKSDRALSSTPVVVLSTSDADLDVTMSYGLGANCYIIKPFGIDAFMRVVESIGEFWFSVVKLPPRELLQEHRDRIETRLRSGAFPEDRDVLRVLLVEDVPGDAAFVREILGERRRPSFEVVWRDRLDLAIEEAGRESFDVVLLDLGLPDSQGVETYARFSARVPDLPVVISTGLDDDDTALAAIRSGAQEYVLKSEWDGRVLSRVLKYAIERKWSDNERQVLLMREHSARDAAEKALLARDEFLAVASHELRTPVTSLLMQSDLLRRLISGEVDEPRLVKIRKIAKSLDGQLKRLVKLVDNLLDISRINAGRLSFEFNDFDLGELVGDIVERYGPQFAEAGCKVTFEREPGIIGRWDRFRIEQVATNLVVNAIKYGRGAPVEIEVGRQGAHAVFKVRDHGIGIRQEDIPKIFGRFQRVVKPTEYAGLGLGLYIVRQIVDGHRGSIRVESEPGRGSTFIVELPIREAGTAGVTAAESA